MTPLPNIDPIVGTLSAQIERAAQASYTELLRLIEGGMDAREAVRLVLESFNGEYVTALTEAFSLVMQTAILPPLVLTMPVGGVYLSQRLYAHLRQTQNEVAAIIKQHAQGLHDARKLARQLYDGYDPKDGIKRPLEGPARAQLPKDLRELTQNPGPRQDLTLLLEQMQRQAARLKSEPLKAAYLELLEKWAQGNGQEELAKRLWVAEREKTRYMADRIAQTELARAYTDRVAGQIMQDDTIEVVQIKLNPRHPLPDICDLHAKADLWGLGPGLYPKAKAPKPPFHPHCWCRLVTRPDLTAAQAKEREDGAREYLRSLPPAEAARILGNRERLDAVLNGAGWEEVTQAGVRPEYRLQRVGDGTFSAMAQAFNMDRLAFSDFFHDKPGAPERFAVAQLTDAEQALFGVNSSQLWLSRISLDEHKARHPEVGMDDYLMIPEIVRNGAVWGGHQERRYLLLRAGDRPYRAAIKASQDHAEAWFLSLVVSGKQKPPKGAILLRAAADGSGWRP